MTIMIVLGSSREGREGEKVARWVEGYVQNQPEITVDFVDTRALALPFFDEVAPPSDLHGAFKSEAAKTWNERVNQADAFIMVTPEYNHGIPAVLKNAIDYVWEGWNYKPVSFVGYSSGMIAGARAVEQLRLVALGVKMLPLYQTVQIPRVAQAFADSGEPIEPKLNSSLTKLVDELVMITQKLAA